MCTKPADKVRKKNTAWSQKLVHFSETQAAKFHLGGGTSESRDNQVTWLGHWNCFSARKDRPRGSTCANQTSASNKTLTFNSVDLWEPVHVCSSLKLPAGVTPRQVKQLSHHEKRRARNCDHKVVQLSHYRRQLSQKTELSICLDRENDVLTEQF